MTTKTTPTHIITGRPMSPAPPLESGDHLTRPEFERRYEAMPWIKKAELIEGVVYMASPVRVTHGRPHGQIMTWLGTYCAATSGVDLNDNTTIRLDIDNEPQPDALLRIEPSAGGHSYITEDDYLEGAPEFILEVAASSAAYDLHEKMNAYRRNGVQEYLVWQVYDKRIDWWELQEGEYLPLSSDEHGVVYSKVFPGLCLNVPAMLTGDLAAVLATQQGALGSAEHTAFIKRLAEKES